MAVNNWFQDWSAPQNLYADYQPQFTSPVQNISSKHSNGHNQPSNFLPLFFQLGLLNPSSRETSNAPPNEQTGPFRTVYHWNVLDFAYPTDDERFAALASQEFIPENNLPLGVEVYKDRIFVSMPKWKPGVPATLAVLPKLAKESSPKLVPYPNWDYHKTESCDGITSVFRVKADTCGRLWVLDSGQIDVTIKPRQVCPPAIFVFDLTTDELLFRYVVPDEFIKEDGLFSNIAVDIRDGDCANAHAYLTDVWRFALVVFSLQRGRSWRVTDHLFFPEPLAAAYNVHGVEFEWTDGLFGMALSPYDKVTQERLLYFHPMSSFREFYVKTSVICNETGWSDVKNAFKVIGQSRGKSGHASASGMDRSGVMFFNLVTRDSIACWDSRKPYKRDNIGIVAKDATTLIFPNDLKLDEEKRQSIWVLSNKLPFYLYKQLDTNDINFRIMTSYVDEAITGTICDPRVRTYDAFISHPDGADCY